MLELLQRLVVQAQPTALAPCGDGLLACGGADGSVALLSFAIDPEKAAAPTPPTPPPPRRRRRRPLRFYNRKLLQPASQQDSCMQANPSACQAARRAPPRAAGRHAGKSQCMHAARGGRRAPPVRPLWPRWWQQPRARCRVAGSRAPCRHSSLWSDITGRMRW